MKPSFLLLLQCAVVLTSVDCICNEDKCKLSPHLLNCGDRAIYINCLTIEQYLCKVPQQDDKRDRFEKRIVDARNFVEYLGCTAPDGKVAMGSSVSVIWLLVPFLLFVIGFTLSFWFQRGNQDGR